MENLSETPSKPHGQNHFTYLNKSELSCVEFLLTHGGAATTNAIRAATNVEKVIRACDDAAYKIVVNQSQYKIKKHRITRPRAEWLYSIINKSGADRICYTLAAVFTW